MASWIDKALALWREAKAAPQPGQFFPPTQSSYAAPFNWEGWPDRGGTGRGLTSLYRSGDKQQDLANAKIAITSVWAYACCSAIAGELSAARLVVKQRVENEGETDVENHPWEKLWEQPNPFFGRAALMQYWAWSLLLQGEAYLFLRPVGGTLTEIWPIPPWQIEPIASQDAFIDGYALDPGGGTAPIRIESKYIVYSRLTNPFDPRRGLSPLVAAMPAIESDLAMRRWNKNFFAKDNAAPEGLIAVPRDMLDSDLERVRSEIRDFFSDGSRRVAVARTGDLDWKPFGRTQKDMEFLQGREFSRTEISRAFGIPDGYWDKDATRANAEGAKATMIETAVWPKLVLLMEDLNAQAAPNWIGDPDIRITFDDIRPRNLAQELQEFTAYSAVLTINELRRLTDRDALPDYRGLLTIEELKKGAPLPNTVPAFAAEADDEEPEPEEEAPMLEPAPDAEPMVDAEPPAPMPEAEPDAEPLEEQPDAELKAWERKALRAIKAGKPAAVRFEARTLDPAVVDAVRARLADATTAAAVKATFAEFRPAPEHEVNEAIDAAMGEALRWARWALEEQP